MNPERKRWKDNLRISGDLILKEHAAAKWLAMDELDSVEWLPADIALIDKLKEVK